MTGLRRFTNLLLIVAFTAGCAISRAPGSRVFDIRLSADQIVVQQVPHGLFVASPVVHTQHLRGRRRPTVWWLSIKRQDTSARQFRRQSLGHGLTIHSGREAIELRIAIGDESEHGPWTTPRRINWNQDPSGAMLPSRGADDETSILAPNKTAGVSPNQAVGIQFNAFSRDTDMIQQSSVTTPSWSECAYSADPFLNPLRPLNSMRI